VASATVTRPSKYRARPVVLDGIRFDSMREGARYLDLKILVAAGQIRDLELHPRYPLSVVELFRCGDCPPWIIAHCGVYTADFRYVDAATGEVIVEDTKSGPTRTTAYRLRKRIVEAIHGVTIREL
jgi:hypothetical protein